MTLFDRRHLLKSGVAAALLSPVSAAASVDQLIWTFDNLTAVGGHSVAVEGAPQLTTSPWGPAVAFDGVADALFIDAHPLAGALTFTWEAVFRPDGGAFEQRWFHLESAEDPPVEPGKGKTRMLFEIRVVEDQWYLDAFMTGPGYKQTLIVPQKLFPIGQWYHVAQSYDGKTYRCFVDGALQMEADMPFAAQGPGRASVGVRMNRVNPFKGAIREARFTHRALDPKDFTRPALAV